MGGSVWAAAAHDRVFARASGRLVNASPRRPVTWRETARSADPEVLAQIDPAHVLVPHHLVGRSAHQDLHRRAGCRRDPRYSSVSRTLWSVISTPMPRVLRSCDQCRISPTAIGSTPAKGSSSSRYFGSAARQRAISTRRRSPPERDRAGARRRCVIEKSDSSSSSRSSRLMPRRARRSRGWRGCCPRRYIPRKIDTSCGR